MQFPNVSQTVVSFFQGSFSLPVIKNHATRTSCIGDWKIEIYYNAEICYPQMLLVSQKLVLQDNGNNLLNLFFQTIYMLATKSCRWLAWKGTEWWKQLLTLPALWRLSCLSLRTWRNGSEWGRLAISLLGGTRHPQFLTLPARNLSTFPSLFQSPNNWIGWEVW